MKVCFLIIMVSISGLVYSQKHSLGLKGGIAGTSINDDNSFSTKVGRSGFSGGLIYEYELKNKLILGSDLLYQERGFGNRYIFGDQIHPTKGLLGSDLVWFNYNYLSLPLKVGRSFGRKFHGITFIGLCPSYLLNAKTIYPDNSKTDNTKKVKRFDAAGQIELGCGYRFYKNWTTFLTFNYFQSFTSLSTDEYFAGSDIRHNGLIISLGIKYGLKK